MLRRLPERKRIFEIYDDQHRLLYTLKKARNRRMITLLDPEGDELAWATAERNFPFPNNIYHVDIGQDCLFIIRPVSNMKRFEYICNDWEIHTKVPHARMTIRKPGWGTVDIQRGDVPDSRQYSTYYSFHFPDEHYRLFLLMAGLVVLECPGREEE
ncbi:MAG: hypothetical protein IJ041_04100 [Clostridia bacterium]|nr:hypothetical protein [Clostridia bacterium]